MMTMLNTIMQAGGNTNEDFWFPLHSIKSKLDKKLLEVCHMNYADTHTTMVNNELDVQSVLKLMKKGAYAEAQAQFEAALAEDEKFAEAHNTLAFSLRKQGKEHWDSALEHYSRAVELKPELAEAYMYRGVLYSLMGDEESALADPG